MIVKLSYLCMSSCSGKFWEFPRIMPRVSPYQEYHRWRSSSTHQVSHSTPRRDLGPYPTSHSSRRDLGPCPDFTSNLEERIPSLVLAADTTLREKLQDQALLRSSQHGSSMRIHTFTGTNSAPGYLTFQTTSLFQRRWLRMAVGISACQSQQSSAAIRAVIEGF